MVGGTTGNRLGVAILAIAMVTLAAPTGAAESYAVPCERYEEHDTVAKRTFVRARATVPTEDPIPHEAGIGMTAGVGGTTGDVDQVTYGAVTQDGTFQVSANGIGAIAWQLLEAAGPDAGEVIAEGTLTGATPASVLFEGAVPSEQVCFVAEPLDAEKSHAHEFVFGDPIEQCASAGVDGGDPVGDDRIEVCAPAGPT